MPTLTIQGLDGLIVRLGRMQTVSLLRAPMQRSLERLVRDLANYPAASGRTLRSVYGGNGFKSAKQRRFVMAAIRSGRITVPYRRTGTLGHAWTQKIEESPGGIVGTVGNKTAYGPFVQADPSGPIPHQSKYHEGTWQTDASVLRAAEAAIVADFTRSVEQALR